MEEKDINKAPKKNKKLKILMVLLFIAINAAVIAITAFSEFGNSENAAELSEVKINWWLLIPAALCFVIAINTEIEKYRLMIKTMAEPGAFKGHDDRKLARRVVILGRYYDNITPAAIGGQPFQIYYLHKKGGLSTGLSTAVSLFGMISIQITFIAIALFCFIFSSLAQENAALLITALLGLLFYAFWPFMVFIALFFPKTTTKIITLIVRFLAKIKIVKNRDRAIKKTEENVTEYVRSVKIILKKPGLFFKTIGLSFVFNILVAMIPYFVLTAFGGDVSFFSCFALTIAVMSAVYFIPTPGNSGAAEGTFYMVFSALSTGYVFWAMLFWRLFSYYIYIIMGVITYFIMQLEKRRGKDA
ncbi:flippase-like domain-containing protein [Candidatus Saccharibacteria bacterium]|nr:flippase-like domain-containing protein [Candidatus Saccharibacteria bacterium]